MKEHSAGPRKPQQAFQRESLKGRMLSQKIRNTISNNRSLHGGRPVVKRISCWYVDGGAYFYLALVVCHNLDECQTHMQWCFMTRTLITVRKEEPADTAAIRRINEQAFGRKAEADLVDLLREHDKVILSLVAIAEDEVVGHILFREVSIEAGERLITAIGLAPMAVLPKFQNCGIGSLLVEAGLDGCREAGHERVVVLGHPAYYPRFGFVPASRYGIKSEYDVPDEVFMALELHDAAFQGCAGVAKYQPEFSAV